MFRMRFCSAVLAFALIASSGPAKEIAIRMHEGTELELRGREQLQRLLQSYDLDQWLFTPEVLIQSYVIPHSHPVLTLNTRYLDDDVSQLATFVHEQLHWFLTDEVSEESKSAAMEELGKLYPSPPATPPEGAPGAESTYLHLIVCLLELQALTELLGEARAREQLGKVDHYKWVYRTVLADTEKLSQLLARHGLLVPSR